MALGYRYGTLVLEEDMDHRTGLERQESLLELWGGDGPVDEATMEFFGSIGPAIVAIALIIWKVLSLFL